MVDHYLRKTILDEPIDICPHYGGRCLRIPSSWPYSPSEGQLVDRYLREHILDEPVNICPSRRLTSTQNILLALQVERSEHTFGRLQGLNSGILTPQILRQGFMSVLCGIYILYLLCPISQRIDVANEARSGLWL